MLERATACLKSGAARESLACAQRVPRSRRALHSTFWNHGAGDLELPPWATSAFGPPQDLPLQHGSPRGAERSQKSIQTQHLRNSSAAFEGVFLDFLYPPQAVAWLQGAQAQQWQRWERRNARRLPEGFIVAARGYASGPSIGRGTLNVFDEEVESDYSRADDALQGEQSPSKHGHITLQEGLQEPAVNHTSVHGARSTSANHGKARTSASAKTNVRRAKSNRQEGGNSREHDDAFTAGEQRDDVNYSTETYTPQFADWPSELDHRESASENLRSDSAEIKEAEPKTLQSLQSIMTAGQSGPAQNARELLKEAISIYDQLPSADQEDFRLKRELIQWLSGQDPRLSSTRCMQLWTSLPQIQKDLQTYQAILTVRLSQGHYDSASKLHVEALQCIENGYQITKIFFRHAAEQNRWALAIKVENELRQHRSAQIPLFWLDVSQIPYLLTKALGLLKYMGSLNVAESEETSIRLFAASFSREALAQEFLQSDGERSLENAPRLKNAIPRSQIRGLVSYISGTEHERAGFYRNLFEAMLSPQCHVRYAQLHEVVVYVYKKLTDLPNGAPSRAILISWLRRLTEYEDNVRIVKRSALSFSVFDLMCEWKRHHSRIDKNAYALVLSFYARSGKLQSFRRWLDEFRSVFPNYANQRDTLWTTIWVHSKRADLGQAQQAFAEVKRQMSEHGEAPDVKCWNILLQAHAHCDDLSGALINLQNMMNDAQVKPDKYSFHYVSQLLAKRGDVAGTKNLLRQYDQIVGDKRETPHLGSLMLAHINSGDVATAEILFREALPDIKQGRILGTPLPCFNMLMTAYAKRREIDSTMRIYRWLKEDGWKLDGDSYATVMQALINFGRVQEAYGILRHVMPNDGVEPTEFHYAILIAGFKNNLQLEEAMAMYDEMLKRNIRPSISTRVAYLEAKAIKAGGHRPHRGVSETSRPSLDETMAELRKLLNVDIRTGPEADRSSHGLSAATYGGRYASSAALVSAVIFRHGRDQFFVALKRLLQGYKGIQRKQGRDENLPISLLTAVAAASWRQKRYADVEECWQLAKEQADAIAPSTRVPRLGPARRDAVSDDDNKSSPALQDVSAEIDASAKPGEHSSQDTARQGTTSLTQKHAQDPRAPAPGRRHILTGPLRYYLLCLYSQGRIADAVRTVTQVMNQGYTLDLHAWNSFIQSLCRTQPPLALLAFVLMERFLTPHFPGWSKSVKYPPTPATVQQDLQHMTARNLAPGQVLPQYSTIVWLAAAILRLQRSRDQAGESRLDALEPEMRKYVGNLRLIRRHAPNTLNIVQQMPRVPDKLQTALLSGDQQ